MSLVVSTESIHVEDPDARDSAHQTLPLEAQIKLPAQEEMIPTMEKNRDKTVAEEEERRKRKAERRERRRQRKEEEKRRLTMQNELVKEDMEEELVDLNSNNFSGAKQTPMEAESLMEIEPAQPKIVPEIPNFWNTTMLKMEKLYQNYVFLQFKHRIHDKDRDETFTAFYRRMLLEQQTAPPRYQTRARKGTKEGDRLFLEQEQSGNQSASQSEVAPAAVEAVRSVPLRLFQTSGNTL